MTVGKRFRKTVRLDLEGEIVEVEVIEYPFREGVEAWCTYRGEEVRFSDRQLGQREALRLLKEELLRRRKG